MIDENKLSKAREGDLKSIEELCKSTWEPLYRFIYYKVQNREEAEDITQDTYVKAIKHIQKSNTKVERYISFLKAVSLNVIKDKWRKRQYQGKRINLDDVNPEVISLEDSTEVNAQREVIKDALGRLNEEQRRVIELRILEGYSVADTAKIMNKKEGTVRVVQYRALQNLADILKNND